MRRLAALLAAAASMGAETVRLDGIARPVEILRDRWGIPHIYAANQKDLFFAQGYMAARDRLFQIDLWRRVGTGRLAEVLGPQALARDRLARAVGYRGDWEREWRSYSPDTREIVTAFTGGINQYIRSLDGKRPLEFRLAGYDPGLWKPEDCLARMAGLLMTRNLTREIARAEAARELGLEKTQKYMPPDPFIRLEVPKGLDLADITPEIIAVYSQAIGPVRLEPEQQLRLSIPPGPPGPGGAPRPGAPERRWALQALNVQSSLSGEGSNNWVVDGTRTVTGKPLLANDPHRPVLIPALRKTVHLVAPGWNAIGAGEPGLPGIALGHNEKVAFGFTIVGLDQVDLYVEKLNPANPDQYRYKGAWRNLEVERDEIAVKGGRPEPVELRRTVHGPVIH
ncbi:MAG: penicillin acylase family protein, partial [Acidobacteria bacterium]|nr:penicillin acylase family protein [Acidobacteriota bacterium]